MVPASSIDDGAFLADQAVEYRRLADVRATDQREPRLPRRVLVARLVLRRLGQELHDAVEQVAGASTVKGGDGNRLAQAERVQRGHVGLLTVAVDLVRDHQHRNGRPAEAPSERRILLGDPRLHVHDQQDEVGLGGGAIGLVRHERLDPPSDACVAAGIDQGERPIAPRGLHLDTVAGDTGHLIGDRLAPSEQPVDQRRLADVLPADHRDPRNATHRKSSGSRS